MLYNRTRMATVGVKGLMFRV